MKKLTLLAFAFSAALSVTAQTPSDTYPDTFIKGVLNIQFYTRLSEKPIEGAVDTYKFSVNVSNSSKFAGTITQLPTIAGAVYGIKQAGSLTFDLKTDVVNPRNPAQTRNVGKIFGVVPVSPSNVYDFNNGTLKTQVFAIGAAKAFESKFSGLALGKPPTPSDSVLSSLKKATLNFSKSVRGQTMTIAVTKYDVMQFQQHVLAAGPVQIYGEVTVNGTLVYDYDRSSWYFQHVSIQYWDNGRQIQDNLSGDIRWIEDDNRKTNGLGEYDFDVRINEPPPNESAVFSKPSDESAFFATDSTVQGLTGTMKYKDTMTSDGNVTASAVDIDLKGNKLTKQQAMYLCKLLLFSTVVPLNAE